MQLKDRYRSQAQTRFGSRRQEKQLRHDPATHHENHLVRPINHKQQQQLEQQQPRPPARGKTKNSFRGNIKYSDPLGINDNSIPLGPPPPTTPPMSTMPNSNRQASVMRSRSSPSNNNHNAASKHNKHNHHNTHSNNNNGNSNGNSSSRNRNSNSISITNSNNIASNDELKDYKSKIKNKYNIDYDHSLDEEYEIIEAVE